MRIGVPRESFPGERRVATVPAVVAQLNKIGHEVLIEPGAGTEAGFSDEAYVAKGAKLAAGRGDLFASAELILQVRCLGANPVAGRADLPLFQPGQLLYGQCDPLASITPAQALAERGVIAMAAELMPRITRAQVMDVLSSQATVAGYKAVLVAADRLPRFLPMFMSAAGTIAAARVLIIGAGVAGLQAIATARRLGAVVQAYDVRPAVREQVESLGARFLDIGVEAAGSEDKGGYAKAMDDSFYVKQREAMTRAIAESDVVITTAAIPGKRSPILVTAEMVRGMRAGSVIVDLAAERGGNCELTRADEEVLDHGVTILGPTNLASTVPHDASTMYARNMLAFIQHVTGPEGLKLDPGDEIVAAITLTREGQVVHGRVKEIARS